MTGVGESQEGTGLGLLQAALAGERKRKQEADQVPVVETTPPPLGQSPSAFTQYNEDVGKLQQQEGVRQAIAQGQAGRDLKKVTLELEETTKELLRTKMKVLGEHIIKKAEEKRNQP